MNIYGITKTTLIDFPGTIACIIFVSGCNFRCPYCHNPELVNFKIKQINEEEIYDFLKKREGKLDGIVITGGEPTLDNDLINFLKHIRKFKYKIKLDTNGSNPEILIDILNNKLVDYIAMDYKAPLNKYSIVSNSLISKTKIKESMEIIKSSNLQYEFRTTIVKELLTLDDLKQISRELEGSKIWYLQKFVPNITLDKKFIKCTTYDDEELSKIVRYGKKYVENVIIR